MSAFRNRALDQFPMVLLTLVSIIQALALELLWSKITSVETLWTLNAASLLNWGMIIATFLGILQLWIMYSCMVMGFRWIPTLRDSIFPFVIGIQEFLLVALIDNGHPGYWMLVLASVFVSANVMSHQSFRRAREVQDNELFFRTRTRATWRDFKFAYVVFFILTGFGIVSEWLTASQLIPLIGSIMANLIIVVQLTATRKFWRAILDTAED